jgi:hypothetical protein
MLRIGSQSYRDLVAAFGEDNCPPFLLELAATSPTQVPAEAPFIELGYDEISGGELDALFAFAQISKSCSPIGVHGIDEPLTVGEDRRTQRLLFPLAGLEAHLRSEAASIASVFDGSGGMDGFVRVREDELTAAEYLVAGLLELIRRSNENQSALLIRW